jgi:hypothetical protein
MTKSDPTKNPEFQKVVRHFLTTPPQPHKPLATVAFDHSSLRWFEINT